MRARWPSQDKTARHARGRVSWYYDLVQVRLVRGFVFLTLKGKHALLGLRLELHVRSLKHETLKLVLTETDRTLRT